MEPNETLETEDKLELHKNAACCFEQILEAPFHKIPANLGSTIPQNTSKSWKHYSTKLQQILEAPFHKTPVLRIDIWQAV